MDLDQNQVQKDELKLGNVHQELSALLKKYQIQSLLDARCGNFNWMERVCLDEIKYIGVDKVSDLIEINQKNYSNPNRSFLTLDIVSSPLPQCDLIFCRDCLVHLPYESVVKAIANFKKSGAKYLLATTFLFPRQNCPDILFGNWHPLNLMAPPFNLPPPIHLINEHCTESNGTYLDKSLALWKLDDLQTSSQIIEEISDHIKHKKFSYVKTMVSNPTEIDPLTFVSIVMTTHNRKEQLLYTLESLTKSISAKLITVIIVDDSTDCTAYLTEADLIRFPFQITYITIDPQKKKWVNPCVNYNIGFNEVKTDRVIIQNAEVCHSGDITQFVVDNLTSQNYLVFDVCALKSIESNHLLYQSGHQYNDVQQVLETHSLRWYQHSIKHNENWHFLTAITRENLIKLDGFNNRFALGSCFDDAEILHRIRNLLKLTIQNVSNEKHMMLGIHQWHTTSMQPHNTYYHKINRLLYQKIVSQPIMDSCQIPKIFNAYWDQSPLSYMNYLTVKSFAYYHPNWVIHIYVPTQRTEAITWTTGEQKIKYIGRDYWSELTNIPNLAIIPINFEHIGFSNNVSEVIKSDYLRWHLLSTVGGIWSDFDILYVNSIDQTLFNPELGQSDFDTLIFYVSGYYPIGFFVSKPNNEFFAKLKQLSLQFYNPNSYQCIGALMIKQMWQTPNLLITHFPKLKFRIEDKSVYLPYEFCELDQLFNRYCPDRIKSKTIGIHWFNGSNQSKHFQNQIESELTKNQSTMAIMINQFIEMDQLKLTTTNSNSNSNLIQFQKDSSNLLQTESKLENGSTIRQELLTLFQKYQIQSLLDTLCANFNWIQNLPLDGIKYIGVVPDVIQMNNKNDSNINWSLLTLDIVSDHLPQCDLIFCRDCLVHLPYGNVIQAIKNFKTSGAKYLLTTTFLAPRQNRPNISLGEWHPLNLMAPPFNFPSPIHLLNEQCMEGGGNFTDKSLALWRLDDLKITAI